MNRFLRLTQLCFCGAVASVFGMVAISATTWANEDYPTSEPVTVTGGSQDFDPIDLIHDATLGPDITPEDFRRQTQEDLQRSTQDFRRQQMERFKAQQAQPPAPAAEATPQ